MNRPHVVLHSAISIDGCTTGFAADLGMFYEIAARWGEDATLAGADTILTALASQELEPEEGDPPDKGTAELPLLCVTDSLGRIDEWERVRAWPYWDDIIVLCSRATPHPYLVRLDDAGINYLICGETSVDLPEALAQLRSQYGIHMLRVESGGRLNAALIQQDLVDELSLLIHPIVAGSKHHFLMHGSKDLPTTRFVRVTVEERDAGLLWLLFRRAD